MSDLPSGPFDVIVADPPWRYEFSSSNGRRIENHYATQTVNEIAALDVRRLAAPDSVLYLWAPAPKLPEALVVLRAWGFSYRTGAVWDKELMGPGRYVRVQHEHLLIGRRGAYLEPADKAVRSVFRAERGRHSAKPECVYAALERMYPNARRADLYARRRRPGWTCWGDELASRTRPET